MSSALLALDRDIVATAMMLSIMDDVDNARFNNLRRP